MADNWLNPLTVLTPFFFITIHNIEMYLIYTKLNYVHLTNHWQATLYEEILPNIFFSDVK